MTLHRPITRRDALKLGLAAAAAPAFRWLPAPPSFTFAHFSDTHVALSRNVDECRALVAEIAETMRPALAINGGDVVDYGWPGEYDNYARVLAGLPYPVHHVPGNHDVRWAPRGLQIFRERVGAPFRSFDHGGCRFVLLDSTVPLSHYGHFESAQLRWLEAELRRVGRRTPVFVVTHHWTGRAPVMVDNERALFEVLEPYNVKTVLTGHGHSDLLWDWHGIPCTMSRGLYQGSYLRVEVDAEAGEVRIARRTKEQPTPQPLTRVPLAPAREKRPVWALGALAVSAGQPVPVGMEGMREARWNEGAWAPLASAAVRDGRRPRRAQPARAAGGGERARGGAPGAWSAARTRRCGPAGSAA